jgi:hypothetical protein
MNGKKRKRENKKVFIKFKKNKISQKVIEFDLEEGGSERFLNYFNSKIQNALNTDSTNFFTIKLKTLKQKIVMDSTDLISKKGFTFLLNKRIEEMNCSNKTKIEQPIKLVWVYKAKANNSREEWRVYNRDKFGIGENSMTLKEWENEMQFESDESPKNFYVCKRLESTILDRKTFSHHYYYYYLNSNPFPRIINLPKNVYFASVKIISDYPIKTILCERKCTFRRIWNECEFNQLCFINSSFSKDEKRFIGIQLKFQFYDKKKNLIKEHTIYSEKINVVYC